MHTHTLINLKEVKKQTSLSAPTIWRLGQKGDFPKNRKISPNRVAWLQSEISDWIAEKMEGGAK